MFKSPVPRRNIVACICCVCGIILVVGFDSGELKGNLLAIASAVLYSAYSLMLRAKSPDNVDLSMSMMFGFVGLCSHLNPPFSTSYKLFPRRSFFVCWFWRTSSCFAPHKCRGFIFFFQSSNIKVSSKFKAFPEVFVARPENASVPTAKWLFGFNGQRCLMGSGCDHDVAFRCLGWACTHDSDGLDCRFHLP